MKKILFLLSALCLSIFAKAQTYGNPQNELKLNINDTASQFTVQMIDGQKINLSELKGKVVLLNYWATWCPPCIAEMPDLEELYQAYKTQVDFYFVTNDDPEKVSIFMKKHEYTFPIYLLSLS